MLKKIVFVLGWVSVSAFAAVATPVAATGTSGYTSEQQSVLTASENWQQAVDARNPKAIAALYDANAYFYPTFTNEINKNPKALYQYFVNLSQKPQLQVIFDQENPRVYGDVAVNSGLYTFSYLDTHHKTVQVPARFTFVYLKENGQWMIVEHHSSVLPDQPKAKATKKNLHNKPKKITPVPSQITPKTTAAAPVTTAVVSSKTTPSTGAIVLSNTASAKSSS